MGKKVEPNTSDTEKNKSASKRMSALDKQMPSQQAYSIVYDMEQRRTCRKEDAKLFYRIFELSRDSNLGNWPSSCRP
jgi:hypothetical protein